jgi:hypothetical protein
MNGAALDELIRALRRAGLEFSAEDLADALWLAPRLPRRTSVPKTLGEETSTTVQTGPPPEPPPPPPAKIDQPVATQRAETTQEKSVSVHLPAPAASPGEGKYGVRVRLPDAPGIPQALEIARKMRPLRRREPTTRYLHLDESKTAERLAAGDIWLPVLKPGTERWLSAILVIDIGASMAIWQTVLRSFRRLVETLGAFRTVEQWWLDTEDPAWTHEAGSLTPLFASKRSQQYRRRPLDVVNPSGRQFILVISDCVSDAWRDGRVARLLGLWGRSTHTALLQVLPRNTWERTALGPDRKILLRSPHAACPNSRIAALAPSRFRGLTRVSEPDAVALPVLELSPQALGAWARWLVQDAGGMHPGRVLEFSPPTNDANEDDRWTQGLGQPFLTLASRTARQLANVMAVAPPFNLPLLRVIRESMLAGQATQVHEAEFLLGGLVKIIAGHHLRFERPDEVLYDFHSEELRKLFRAAVRVPDALRLLRIEQVSRYLGERLGQPRNFPAYLASPADHPGALQLGATTNNDPIARFTSSILQWFGGHYAALLQAIPRPGPRSDLGQRVAAKHPLAWVLVAGTGSYGLPQQVRTAAERVGGWLAKLRYGLVTGGWQGVDHVVARTFADTLRDTGLSLTDFLVHVVKRDRTPDFREGRWELVENDRQEFERSVELADGVILIGGLGGTKEIGNRALAARVPVYPLASTGGDAEQLFDEILANWDAFTWLPLSRSEFFTLRREELPLDLIRTSLQRNTEGKANQHGASVDDENPDLTDLADTIAAGMGSLAPRATPDQLNDDRPVRRISPRWAIVIGVNEYQDGTLPPLSHPLRDAAALYGLLRDNGYAAEQVTVLGNVQATRAAVQETLRRLIEVVEEGDLLLFHFSGHAVSVRGEPVLLLSDSVPSDITTGLSLAECLNVLRLAKGLRLVVLLDAGRDGQFLRDIERVTFGSFFGRFFRNTTHPHIAVLAACTPEADESSGGLVVQELLEGNGLLVKEVLECVQLWAASHGIQDISVRALMDYVAQGMRRNEEIFYHRPKWMAKSKGNIETLVFRRFAEDWFEIDICEITLTVRPQQRQEYQVGAGRFRRTVQCDNVADLLESVTFAGTNRLQKDFLLRYTTTGGGFVEAQIRQPDEARSGQLYLDEFQYRCTFRFQPEAGETFSLAMRVYQGYGPGNRYVKFRLPESDDRGILAHYKTVRLVLDLRPYTEAGYLVQPAPRLVRNSTWEEGADPTPVGEELPISQQAPGLYTYELQNIDQTVLNLVWDVVRKDSKSQ